MIRVVGRLLRAAGAAVVLLVALAVLPAALVVVQSAVAWDWRAIVAQPMSPPGALAAAIGVGWLVWLALVWQILLDTVAALRGTHRTVRLPVPLHTAVTALAGGVLLALHAVRGGTTVTAPIGAAGAVAALDAGQPQSEPGTRAVAVVVADGGVVLPGGWLPLPVAGAVAAAVALAWTQARRRYPPSPPAGWHRHDPDLPTPTAAVRHLLRAVRAVVDDQPLEAGVAEPTDLEPSTTAASGDAGGTADAASLDPDRAPTLLDVLPAGELHLTGPGRHDAARGLLVALTAVPDRPPRTVLTDHFASTVLGAPHAHTAGEAAPTRTAGGRESPDSDVVVFTASPDPGDARTPLDAGPLRPAGPEPAPDPGTVGAVRCTIRVAATPGGSAACWHVAGDGTVHAVTGHTPAIARLPILDQRTAVDILRSLDALPSPDRSSRPGRDDHQLTGHTTDAGATLAGWPDPPPDIAGADRRLLVRVFGEVTVLRPRPDGSYSPVLIRRTAGRQIIVLLALHRDGLTDDELKEALWPDVLSSAAHRRFATTMSELHGALHAAAGRPVLHDDRSVGAPAAARRHRLDPAAVQVDLWRLQGLLDAAATTTDPAYRQLLLAAAADVAGGELAAGWTHEWLLADRERIVRHLLDVHTHLAELEPDDHAALRLLHQALQFAPTNEHLHRRVLQRHAAAGDHDGLRRAAAILIEHLTAHHLQPEPATVALLTTLLTGPRRPPDPPTGTGPGHAARSPDDPTQR